MSPSRCTALGMLVYCRPTSLSSLLASASLTVTRTLVARRSFTPSTFNAASLPPSRISDIRSRRRVRVGLKWRALIIIEEAMYNLAKGGFGY